MNFFKRIIERVKSFFRKEELIMLPEVEEVKDTKDVQDEKGEVIKPNIFDIELLQRKYENNIVSLDELTDEDSIRITYFETAKMNQLSDKNLMLEW